MRANAPTLRSSSSVRVTLHRHTRTSFPSCRFLCAPSDGLDGCAFDVRRELSQLKPMGGTAILQQAVAHPAMPPRSGYVRAEILRGVFVVQPVRGNARVTNFTFSQQVKVGGIVPAWLMNTLIAQDAVVFVKRLGKAASKHEKSLR